MDQATAVAARLGLTFADPSLLAQALRHGSYVNEHPDEGLASNERLEFLGDAVLGLVISEALYARHPGEDEGALTARRAAVVSTRALARLALRIGLGEHLAVGQGADHAGERRRPSVLAATLEAVAGAVYLDGGLEEARRWILGVAAEELDAPVAVSALKSPKSLLQEATYARGGAAPVYRVLSAEGPDHARHFVVEAIVDGEPLGRGEGSSRREAETAAAAAALAVFGRGAVGSGDADSGADQAHRGAPQPGS